MNTIQRLDELLKDPPLILSLSRPTVWFSDLHMGDGGPADNFESNERIFARAFHHYDLSNYEKFFLGDIQELWQFSQEEVLGRYDGFIELIRKYGHSIGGNHDRELGFPEAILFTGLDTPILAVHGNQGDWVNDRWWKLGRFFTRWVWKPLEMIGIQDSTSASKSLKRHDLVRRELVNWANSRKVILICGHIHSQEHEGYYWNIGSGITPGRIECIEWDGSFRLKTWT